MRNELTLAFSAVWHIVVTFLDISTYTQMYTQTYTANVHLYAKEKSSQTLVKSNWKSDCIYHLSVDLEHQTDDHLVSNQSE